MRSERKIIRLFSRLNVGGPAIHVVNLSAGLARYGYDTTLVAGSCDVSEGSMDDFAVQNGVNLHIIPEFQAAISPVKDFLSFRIVKLLWRERPQVVHTHTFKAGLLGRGAAILTGVPVIVHTYHGHLLSGYWGAFGTNIIRWIETLLARFTSQIIAVSGQVADDLATAGVAPREKIRVVELGFDVHEIKRQLQAAPSLRRDLGIPSAARVVGIVGRLVPVKSVDLFLRSLIPLLMSHPELHLVVIGDGADGERLRNRRRPDLIAALALRGMAAPIIPDLRDLDLVVCSSKNEGTSVSIIEAVIAGIPVISTRVGGMADLLADGRWGTLVNYSESELRTAVADMLEAKDLAERCREASEHFSQRFSVERLLRETDMVYRSQGVQHVEP